VQDPYYYVKCKWLNMCDVSWEQKLKEKQSDIYGSQGFYANTVSLRLRWWFLTTEMMLFISLMLNLFTILDLYIVLTNPFKNPSGRPAMWLWTSVSIAFIFSTFSLIETEDKNSRFTTKTSS